VRGVSPRARQWMAALAFTAACVVLYTVLGYAAEAQGQHWTQLWELNLR
jgi:hypothetical protein